MNIYIKIELLHREIEGRLLLALVAAERGHRVLLGDLSALLSHRRWLPPGVFHDKSLTPSRGKTAHHRALAAAGFLVTSQDEEHGLLGADYLGFLAQRFAPETLATAAAVMTWGPFDHDALVEHHAAVADRITMTGSPRVDLWRPDLAAFSSGLPRPGVDGDPYILVCTSNVPRVPFWVSLRDTRPTYFRIGPDPAADMARAAGDELLHAAEVIRGVAALREALPALRIVVRPHPAEDDHAWVDLLAAVPDVVVTRHGGLGRWVRGAVAVVHNGSTSALEAAVGGVPAIPYTPTGLRRTAPVNLLGRPAVDPGQLVARVAEALDPAARDRWYADEAGALLRSRLAALDGRLASDRIVDAWEALDGATTWADFSPRARSAVAATHAAVGAARVRLRGGGGPSPFGPTAKFPRAGLDEVDALHGRLVAALGRFDTVRIRRIGPRLVSLRG